MAFKKSFLVAVMSAALLSACGSSGTGSGGDGGSADVGSAGSVTLTFQVPPAKTYCQTGECGPASSIIIKNEAGDALVRYPGDCYTPCDTCEPLACPGFACQPQGYGVTGESFVWDGTVYSQSTCGVTSSCVAHLYAPPGKYTAVMCATPGALVNDNNGVPQCMVSGPVECVEVPFDYPAQKDVLGELHG